MLSGQCENPITPFLPSYFLPGIIQSFDGFVISEKENRERSRRRAACAHNKAIVSSANARVLVTLIIISVLRFLAALLPSGQSARTKRVALEELPKLLPAPSSLIQVGTDR